MDDKPKQIKLAHRRARHVLVCLQIGLLALFASPAVAETPSLSLPVQCELQSTCFIQNYVDTDPSPEFRDHQCGKATYDGHKGTDIRVLSVLEAAKGVTVVAAAPGRVKGGRDGMQDRLVGKQSGAVQGKECGNGIVIDHGNGWETQYCHMRQGSVLVRKGAQVKRGQPLGLVGYSGKAQFAHLHLSVRHQGRIIDPFIGEIGGDANCNAGTGNSLWEPAVRQSLAYIRGEMIEMGFTTGPVTSRDLEQGKRPPVSATSTALVFYARYINLEAGDVLHLALTGPDGVLANSKTKPLDTKKAQYVAFAGRKLRAAHWPAGRYQGKVRLMRAGKAILDHQVAMEMRVPN